jgi:hypothetical protein
MAEQNTGKKNTLGKKSFHVVTCNRGVPNYVYPRGRIYIHKHSQYMIFVGGEIMICCYYCADLNLLTSSAY